MSACIVHDCDKLTDGRRECSMHARRRQVYGSYDLPTRIVDYSERFWSRVDRSGECWIWTKGKQHEYGVFYAGRSVRAHVFSYEEASGQAVPEGHVVDHICRTKLCVRPEHLRAIPRGDNSQNVERYGLQTRTGVRGVTFHKGSGRYHARLTVRGQMHFVGVFDSVEEADLAVSAARRELHPLSEVDK